MKKSIILIFLISTLFACDFQFVNSETSQIGDTDWNCLDSLAWEKLCEQHSIDSIKDKEFVNGLKLVENHFLKPKYILYFNSNPKEIVGCDWYSIRVAFNPNISNDAINGLSADLSNKEQKRIRNRVWKELYKHQCKKGQNETIKKMERDVPFSESHKNYGPNYNSLKK